VHMTDVFRRLAPYRGARRLSRLVSPMLTALILADCSFGPQVPTTQNVGTPACIAACKADKGFTGPLLFVERGMPEQAHVDRSSAPESGVTCMANIFDLPADRIRPGALKALFTGSADTEVSPWEPLSSADCQLVLTNRFNVAGPSEDALGALLSDVRIVDGSPAGSLHR
jgi:hypothetical protein